MPKKTDRIWSQNF